ncbi:MAG TPA: sialidase family protein [Chloroflexota bacterium]|nr:sialidase family protein [Chloroflexota bacterium]
MLSQAAPDAPQAADWAAPDFCLTAGFGIPPEGAKHVGYVQLSRDRGRTWHGPYPIPQLAFARVQVKPDYLVRPDGLVLLFVTVARADPAGRHDGRYGSRFVAVYATPDAGRTWRYLSCILAAAPDTPFVERYYASPVLLPDGRILVALRCQLNGTNAWPEVHQSEDGGWTWRFLSRVADWGGPTHLRRLEDGRLLAVYGYRVPPFGIRARVSEDEGRTWGRELVLRDDGGSHDLGYPRAVTLPGGRVLVAYYFNRADDAVRCEGGVRHVAGTVFTP